MGPWDSASASFHCPLPFLLVIQRELMMEFSCNILVIVRWFWLLLIHATLLISPAVESVMINDSADALALLAFKQQIWSKPFHSLSTWNDSLPFCQWQGITCSRRHPHRVVAINLTGLQLVGPLSPFIANLSFLNVIDLSQNQLHGQIPQEFGHLFRLRYLNLSHNSMTGEIPANLTHCWRLRIISLAFNKLTGKIPVELGSLSRLKYLAIGKNNLIGSIPTSLGNLSSLTNISLGGNELEGNIPQQLGQLRSLYYFEAQDNKLSGTIPPTLLNLSSIAVISIPVNQLSGSLPPDLGVTLPNLIGFYVGVNRLTGPIPISLSNATRLEQLELSTNQLSGSIPMNLGRLGGLRSLNLEDNLLGSGEAEDMGTLSSLTNCSFLQSLSLAENRLTAALPSSIPNLSTNLEGLYLSYNQITGSIPSGIGNLFNLIILTMASNYMTGTIPEGIGKLSKLQFLDLAGNKLSKEFPSFIGNNTQLFKLLLSENNLEGSIPSTLENCHRLSELYLDFNSLDGYIPKQIFSDTALQILDLEANSLVGSLPMEVGNLNGLRILRVSNNKLSGEIPKTLDNCLGLENLYIDGNFFEGTFPRLSSLQGMLQMDISRNNFSGQIPEYIENFHYLQYLNLSYNDLEGQVPQKGIFKNASAISVVGNRKLCGGSPALLLPACRNQDTKKQRWRFSTRRMTALIISSVLCLILLLSTVYYCARKSKKHLHLHPVAHPLEKKLLKISYGDLCKATDGFSSANLVGVGSYGSVYKGSLDRIGTVAVKVLNLQQRGASKSFTAECKALRNVRHRNLLKIHTICSSIDSKGDDFKALVLDYMAKGNLEQWLHPGIDEQHQSKNLSLIQRLNLAIDVASALNYLHNSCEKPILHCDLKPGNILLDDDMNAHVGDFGLARFLYETTSSYSQNHTNSYSIKGTIGYVAPEYGMGGEVSTFGDIYSYGILLLEIFTGKKPTDEIFNGSLSLHQFAKLALPERVMEIVDQSLLSVEVGLNESQIRTNAKDRLEMCLISIIRVGIACSMISVKDRMEIGDARYQRSISSSEESMRGITEAYVGQRYISPK